MPIVYDEGNRFLLMGLLTGFLSFGNLTRMIKMFILGSTLYGISGADACDMDEIRGFFNQNKNKIIALPSLFVKLPDKKL